MRASCIKYILNFKQPSGTSRGVLRIKETWFLILEQGDKKGIGECGIFRGLSIDDTPEYEARLHWTCEHIHLGLPTLINALQEYPSICFGLEMAYRSIQSQNMFELFPSDFTSGNSSIPINGLIWMGSESDMKAQIRRKISDGFECIKMKIGAIDFQSELNLLRSIRKEFSADVIELRVDANGAFSTSEAMEKLKYLSELDIHSIEQPIRQGQFEEMARLCEESPLPIALDEELIGVFSVSNKENLIQTIQPHYIILKPSLVGGYKGSQEWITAAEQNNVGWWITSALESNIGLNAIAQWTFTLQNDMPQGLGTGSLFTNNIRSPLQVKNGTLRYQNNLNWKLNF